MEEPRMRQSQSTEQLLRDLYDRIAQLERAIGSTSPQQPQPAEEEFLPEASLLSDRLIVPAPQSMQEITASLQEGNPTYQAALQELQSRSQGVRVSQESEGMSGWASVSERVDGARLRGTALVQDLAGMPSAFAGRAAEPQAILTLVLQGERPDQELTVPMLIRGQPGDP